MRVTADGVLGQVELDVGCRAEVDVQETGHHDVTGGKGDGQPGVHGADEARVGHSRLRIPSGRLQQACAPQGGRRRNTESGRLRSRYSQRFIRATQH